jgi:hypothetical protein
MRQAGQRGEEMQAGGAGEAWHCTRGRFLQAAEVRSARRASAGAAASMSNTGTVRLRIAGAVVLSCTVGSSIGAEHGEGEEPATR